MLPFRQPGKFGGSYGTDKAVFFGQLAVPLTLNSLVLFPIILLRSGELLSVVRARLACTERFRDGQHAFRLASNVYARRRDGLVICWRWTLAVGQAGLRSR